MADSLASRASRSIALLEPITARSPLDTPEGRTEVARSLMPSSLLIDWSQPQEAFPGYAPGQTYDFTTAAATAAWNSIQDSAVRVIADALTGWTTGSVTVPGYRGISATDIKAFVKPELPLPEVHEVLVALHPGFILDRAFIAFQPERARRSSPYLVAIDRAVEAALYSLVGDVVIRPNTSIDKIRAFVQFLSTLTASDIARHKPLPPAPAARPTPESLEEKLKKRFATARKLQDPSVSLELWRNFPILGRRAKSAKASRTWGIEMEMVQGDLVQPPPNFNPSAHYSWSNPERNVWGEWSRHRDGSVNGDGTEFVSPVMYLTFDPTFEHMANQAAPTRRDSSASCHVHVNATDVNGVKMNTTHVSRLIEMYALIAPLLEPIIQRNTRTYCRPINVNVFAEYWFKRDYPDKQRKGTKRGLSGVRSDPRENLSAVGWERYTEINLNSLAKYGTIEFRAMGPVYSYEYLTRWAWFCREMCNYASTRLPLSNFAKCKNIGEVLSLLETHGREKFTAKGYVKGDV